VAKKQINELTEITTASGTDLLLVYDLNEGGSEKTKKITYTNLQPSYVKVSDVKSSGVAGGTFTKDAWRTRDLNTEDSDSDNVCTLSSNQITLLPGTYICSIMCPAYRVANNKARLRNTTTPTTILVGITCWANSSDGWSPAAVNGKFTIAAGQVLEVQHYCDETRTSNGFGTQTGFGEDEVFTTVEFWKVG